MFLWANPDLFSPPPPNYVFDPSVQLRIIYIAKRLHVLLECCVD